MDDAGGLERHRVYQIRVRGRLDEAWSDWFEGLSLVPLERGETLLSGPIVDQAALYGILWKLRDLNLPLISVHSFEASFDEGGGATGRGVGSKERRDARDQPAGPGGTPTRKQGGA